MRLLSAHSLAIAVLAASTGVTHEVAGVRSQPRPAALNDGWKTAAADSAGVDPRRLAALTESLRAWPELGVHAILIERSGSLIYEEYFDGFDQRWPAGRHELKRRRDLLHLVARQIAHAEVDVEQVDVPGQLQIVGDIGLDDLASDRQRRGGALSGAH